MDRRSFLKTTAALSAAGLAPLSHAAASGWRSFEVTTRVELQDGSPARIWLPVPSVNTDYQKVLDNRYTIDGGNARMIKDPTYGVGILAAEFAKDKQPTIELVSRISTRDRAVDLDAGKRAPMADAERRIWLRSTELLPTDGIVKETAEDITKGAKTDVEKARAVYEWIVDNTQRDPKTRGCGIGDIQTMLETKNLSGKCADLNALFVGLMRAVGVPARDVYGIRVADSRLGYKSLGKSGDITKAQHCRAEFYAAGTGWVPVDPADVRKVVLEENGGLPLNDAKVEAARKRLFGSWEMNWMAYNYGHDVQLPGSRYGSVGFLMYPNAEAFESGKIQRVDSLDPQNFRYTITARELLV
ncbi:transglutaminase domain-containing protein [Noviherbaspirillum pedocola]|uniref:Transglutaminase n=1 Tax=Noviherbaspirillum pedocola TaxID=2801341 RepID=A0A934T1R0_9BURK|nr:transglutaminase domain-containing protein [Noviherbaspirillum pedocola]MBK4737507.1 transglutaminase [Noviherbaspirillum pedocola]